MVTFQPVQAQRWDIFAGFAATLNSADARDELRAWCGLGLVALAIAGIFALLVALSRVPGIENLSLLPVAFFEKGLVVHVIFSFVVWYLSILGSLTTVVAYRIGGGKPPGKTLAWTAIFCGYGASIMLFVPGLMDGGEPILNNYIPVISDTLYYFGLAVLALAFALSVVRLFLCLPRRVGPLEPVSLGTINASFLFLLAGVCFALAFSGLIKLPADEYFFENLFWGGGHVLQFVNVAMMITAWYLLGGLAFGKPLVNPHLLRLAQALLCAAALMAPLFYFLFETFEFAQTIAFTRLQYAFVLPTILIAIMGFRTWSKVSPEKSHIGGKCLVASIVVFGFGGLLGLFVDGADTRTPAHYHGVIGGINLSFMGLFYVFFLPLIGRDLEPVRSVTLSIWFYATGQILHVTGLFMAGGYGAPRKTAGESQGIEELGAEIALYGMGVGAVIAVIGGVMFIWIAGRALIGRNL